MKKIAVVATLMIALMSVEAFAGGPYGPFPKWLRRHHKKPPATQPAPQKLCGLLSCNQQGCTCSSCPHKGEKGQCIEPTTQPGR